MESHILRFGLWICRKGPRAERRGVVEELEEERNRPPATHNANVETQRWNSRPLRA
jgi:hypothetical protein